MDRKLWYYKEKVTKDEMRAADVYVEHAVEKNRFDDNIYGVITGLVPSLGAAPTVDITKGVAIDQTGKRTPAYTDGASTKNHSYANTTAGVATSVTGGQERWIRIYALHGYQALDPRTDGLGATVYFDQPECLQDGTTGPGGAGVGGTGVDKFLIEAGSSAPTGTATKPTLRTDAVLICDIKRTPSDASNVLDTSARQIFGILDTAAPGTGNGMAIIPTAMTTWRGGRTNPAQASLHAAIDKIITDLNDQTASDDGAERIGAAAGAASLSAGSVRSQVDTLDTRTHMTGAVSWLGGRSFAASDLIQTIVATLIADLAATTASDDGAERVGAQTSGNLGSGSVRSQLDELDAEKGGLAIANAWSAKNTFTQATATNTPVEFGGIPADDNYRLLWQTALSGSGSTTQRVIRFYAHRGTVNRKDISLTVTYNAVWNGTAISSGGLWTADEDQSHSLKIDIGKQASQDSATHGLRVSFKDVTSTPWADTAWANFIGLDNQLGNAANQSPVITFGNQAAGAGNAMLYVVGDALTYKKSGGGTTTVVA